MASQAPSPIMSGSGSGNSKSSTKPATWSVGGMNGPQSSFGGLKQTNNYNPVGGHPSSHGMSTFGANDYANYTVNGIGGSTWAAEAAAYLQNKLQKKQLNLAKQYYNINVIDTSFYETNYQPKIASHKDQAFSTPYYKTDYNMPRTASIARVKVFDDKWFHTRKNSPRYGVGLGRDIDYTFYDARRKAAFGSYVTGTRVEDARKDWKDEQVHAHMVQALNFGITVGNIAKQGLASSTSALMNAYDEMGSRIGGFVNGMQHAAGHNTMFNQTKTALDHSSQSGSNMAPSPQG